jgi:tetratricopeptide (TPR) repeat protein
MAMLLVIYSQKSIAHSLLGNVEEARRSLQEAEKLVKERKLIKVYYSGYLLAACYLELAELKKVPEDTKLKINHLLHLTKSLIKTSKVVYSNLAEGYRLRALTYWMLKKQGKAYRNFEKSIELAERLGAKPELARTCFELGKCLMDQKSRHKIVRSKNGSEYLIKAKSMFEEMDLQWDLQEYERYMDS